MKKISRILNVQFFKLEYKNFFNKVIRNILISGIFQILGCTAPQIRCADALIYIGDGRFHLEAAMIANPKLKAFRYDPYDKKFTEETYDHKLMISNRLKAVETSKSAKTFALILGTLGRQGNPSVLKTIQNKLRTQGKEEVVLLLSEIFPSKIELFKDVDAFVQVHNYNSQNLFLEIVNELNQKNYFNNY